jgi:hypothetical protein
VLFRLINKQRVIAKNLNVYIRFFRLFKETRAEYGIYNVDIYNINESECGIGLKQASHIIPANKKKTFTKQDDKRE